MTTDQLSALLQREIPLTEAMAIEVIEASASCVHLRAPLAPNRNLHGTAFAGSLYTLATLAGWSLVTLLTEELGLSGAVVLRHADVRYLSPVPDVINARAERPDMASCAAFGQQFHQRGKARKIGRAHV